MVCGGSAPRLYRCLRLIDRGQARAPSAVNDPSVKGCLISQEICQASFTSVPVGEFRNASIKFSLPYERNPIVIPVSTGWLVTNEATNVTTTGFTANAANWSNGTHSGNAKYLVLGFK